MLKKISIFILIITLVIVLIPADSYALSLSDKQIDVNNFNPGKPEQSTRLNEIADIVIGFVYYAGIFISVGMLMIIGIKFMMGSLEEKAQFKETLFPYLIGAILLFGGINIIKIIYDVVHKFM